MHREKSFWSWFIGFRRSVFPLGHTTEIGLRSVISCRSNLLRTPSRTSSMAIFPRNCPRTCRSGLITRPAAKKWRRRGMRSQAARTRVGSGGYAKG